MAMTDVAKPTELPPLAPPSAGQGLREVFRRRYLLRLLVRREINVRYSGSFLGMIWSYINPLTQLFMFWFILGIIIGRGIEELAIHVFAALIVVQLFTETFNAGTRSIVRNKPLVQRMPMPREMFPVASMLVSFFHVGPQLAILVVVCVLRGWTPDPVGLGAAALALTLVMLLATALALLFSVANVFFRDFSSFVAILTNFVRFSVPMIYPFTMVEERFRGHTDLYLANPIADAVLLMQRAFWVGATNNPEETTAEHLPEHLFTRGFIALGAAVLLVVIAQLVFTRFENKIPERLS
jgi:ABC-2 type transport system permease protein